MWLGALILKYGDSRMKKVSDKNIKLALDGMLVPINPVNGIPILLYLQEGKMLLPLFTDKEKYSKAAVWGNFIGAKCQMVEQQLEFLNSIIEFKKQISFHVVVDPYITPEGNTRFQLLALDEEEKSYLKEDKNGKS